MPDLPHAPARVSPEEMRRLFNTGRYWERCIAREFQTVVLEERHPSLAAAHEPHCTLSQIVSYRDRSGNEVARVHQYLRRDGTLGGSGRPDPKRLLHQGVLFVLAGRGK